MLFFFYLTGKEKEKERRQSVAAAEVTLSMCADAGKVDRTKLSQTEVRPPFQCPHFTGTTAALLHLTKIRFYLYVEERDISVN